MGITRKAEAQESARSTNHGPHNSNLLNKLDPRVDSDKDNRVRHEAMGGTAGPHSSNIANKANPLVDSDRDNRARDHLTSGQRHAGIENTVPQTTTTTSHVGVGGSTVPQTTTTTSHVPAPRVDPYESGHTHHNDGFGSAYETPGTSSTNTGPHSSNLMNKLDPRVDSDMDNRGRHQGLAGSSYNNPAVGTTAGTTAGTTPRTTAGTTHGATAGTTHGATAGTTHGATSGATVGPHNSNLMNKLDPRVDSDVDNRARHQGLAGSGYNNPAVGTTPRTTAGTTHGATSGATAGPHNSNLVNKVDPRVDSDMDNRGRHQGLAGSSYNNPAVGTTAGTTPRTTAGTTHGATSGTTHGATSGATVGPHKSNLMNKLDPRVDSDLGNRTTGTQRGTY